MKYQDIINKDRPTLVGHEGIGAADRAAQFAPFAALTGFDGVIVEAGRLTDHMPVLDEDALEELNKMLRTLQEILPQRPTVQLIRFCPDARKTGGACLPYTGQLKHIDEYLRCLQFTDGTQIPIDSLLHIAIG